jgi:anthranilate synthase component I
VTRDPWAEFVRAAPEAEAAGYFERAGENGAPGTAVSFLRPERHETIGPRTDPTELAREATRYLRSRPRGGVVGYLGFDAYGLFEPLLRRAPGGSPFPLGEFAFVPSARPAPVRPPPKLGPPSRRSVGRPLADSLSRGRYGREVRRLVRAIRDGEAFQVVLAHRRSWPRPTDLLERAAALRASERYAFFYYLKFGDRELVGATPESVAEIRGRTALVDPIAGTLPIRGGPGRVPLAADPKELAEHRMLVDLARNDLGRVARPGSVRVLWRERRVRFARLEHLVSRVGATLAPGRGPWETLGATFPAGTVSGAPKIRATELLRTAEATWRGPYAGTVGWVGPRGRAEWALTIRTGFAAGRRLFTAAGAGIVHRSEADREYDETLTKLGQVESTLLGGPA